MDLRQAVARILSLPTKGMLHRNSGTRAYITNFGKVLGVYLLTIADDGVVRSSQSDIARSMNASPSQVSKGIEELWVSEVINREYVPGPDGESVKAIVFTPEYRVDSDLL